MVWAWLLYAVKYLQDSGLERSAVIYLTKYTKSLKS